MSATTISIEEFRADYDWGEVLSYAGKDSCEQGEQKPPMASPVSDATMDCSVFGMEDVKDVICVSAGMKEEDSWLCILELRDGRFAYIEACCDYTGWD